MSIGAPKLIVVGALRAHGASRQGAIVVTRRHPKDHMGGYWELPGGKVERGESPVEALERELAEELGVQVEHSVPLTFSYHRYPDRHLLFLCYEIWLCAHSCAPQALASSALKWLAIPDLPALSMPPANEPLVAAIMSRARLLEAEGSS